MLPIIGAWFPLKLMYRKLPAQLKSFVTQLVMSRLMAHLRVSNIAQLHRVLLDFFDHDVSIKREIRSGFWYKKLHGQQFARREKLLRLYKVMPEATSINNHALFTILTTTKRLRLKMLIKARMENQHNIFRFHAAIDESVAIWFVASEESPFQAFENLVALSTQKDLNNLAFFLLVRRAIFSTEAEILNKYLILRAYENMKNEITQVKYIDFVDSQVEYLLN